MTALANSNDTFIKEIWVPVAAHLECTFMVSILLFKDTKVGKGWVVFELGLYCFKINFWLGLYYILNRVRFYSRVGLCLRGYGITDKFTNPHPTWIFRRCDFFPFYRDTKMYFRNSKVCLIVQKRVLRMSCHFVLSFNAFISIQLRTNTTRN